MRSNELLDRALSNHLLPDPLLALGSRAAAARRRKSEREGGVEAQEDRLRSLVWHMSHGPIAEVPERANQQHYELPAEFFTLFLGPRHKYSCAFWAAGVERPRRRRGGDAAAHVRARRRSRTGWTSSTSAAAGARSRCGSASSYPNARVTGVIHSTRSASTSRRRASAAGITNVEIVTADANHYDPGRDVDRVLSIEMFEHMRNWKELLRRIAGRLKPDGKAFVHVFRHRSLAYRFEGTWAAERFFTGGTMPSHDLMLRFQERPRRPGPLGRLRHALRSDAARLARAPGRQLGAGARAARAQLGRREARRQLAAWRLFMVSAAEIWGYHDGDEWLVSQYLLAPRERMNAEQSLRTRLVDALRARALCCPHNADMHRPDNLGALAFASTAFAKTSSGPTRPRT